MRWLLTGALLCCSLLLESVRAQQFQTIAVSETAVFTFEHTHAERMAAVVHQTTDVRVTLQQPDGTRYQAYAPGHDIVPEWLVLEQRGQYQLEATHEEGGVGSVEIELIAIRDEDELWHDALAAAHRAFAAGDVGNQQLAFDWLQKAAAGCGDCMQRPGIQLQLAIVGDAIGQRDELPSLLERVLVDGTPAQQALARTQQGRAAYRAQRLDAALQHMQDAAGRYAMLSMPAWQAGEINFQGLIELQWRNLDRATVLFDEAIALSELAGDRGHIGLVHGNIAGVHFARGDFMAARVELEVALKIHQETKSKRRQADALANLAALSRLEGDYDAVLRGYLLALELQESVGHVPGQARSLHRIGQAYLQLGSYDDALAYLKSALALRQAHALKAGEADTHRALGQLYELIEQRAEARDEYAKAIGLYRESSPKNPALAQSMLDLAELDWLDNQPGAIEEALRAMHQLREHGNAYQVASGLVRLARMRLDDASSMLDEIAELAALTGSRSLLADLTILRAEMTALSGPSEATLRAIEVAYDAHQRVRELIPNAKLRATYDSNIERLIDLHVEILLSDSGDSEANERALLVSEMGKARGLRELIASRRTSALTRRSLARLNALTSVRIGSKDPDHRRDLQQQIDYEIARLDANASGLIDGPEPSSSLIRDLQRELDSEQAVIATRFRGEHLHLWTITKDAVKYSKIEDVAQLVDKIDRLYQWHQVPSFGPIPSAVRALKQELSNTLFKDLVFAPRQLFVSAHGPTYRVVFEQLSDSVATSPEVIYWPTLIPVDPTKSFAADRRGALIVAGPSFSPANLNRLGRLPWSAQEAKNVAAEITNEPVLQLLGDAATRSGVVNVIAGMRLLHFATHAVVDQRRPEQSALILSGDGHESVLTFHDVAGLRLTAEQVVLSACESALGASYSAEGVVGLAYAFLAAGVDEVIATRWQIRDDDAAELSASLYQPNVPMNPVFVKMALRRNNSITPRVGRKVMSR